MTSDLDPAVSDSGYSLNPGDQAAPDSIAAAYHRFRESQINGTSADQSLSDDTPDPVAPRDTSWAVRSFDPDPLGEKPAPGHDSNWVKGLYVTGKYIERAELEQSEHGRELLVNAETNRKNGKRGFWEALTDFKKTDLPFFTMFGMVGGSLSLASQARDVADKVAKGEEISNEERMLLARVQMEATREDSVGGMIGETIRKAPGFMFEFLATDAALSGVRGLMARAGSKSVDWASTFAVNRGTKTLAKELADSEVTSMAVAKAGANAIGKDIATAVRGLDEAAVNGLKQRIAVSLRPYVQETMGAKPAVEGILGKTMRALESPGVYDDPMIVKVAENLANRAVDSAVARQGASNAFIGWARGTTEWFKEHAARSLLDYGTWGTENSTILNTKLGLRAAIADSLGATFIEAPIRGAEMYAVNRLVAKPVIDLVTGNDNVTQSELSLKMTALRNNDRRLYELSPYISLGMDMMEYISENSGRGFTSAMRAVGLATGLAKPAQRALVGEVGGLLTRGKEVEAGGFVRQLLRKALGTTEAYAQRTGETQFRSLKNALRGSNVSDDVIRGMIKSQSIPEELAARIGTSDYKSFLTRSVKDFMKAGGPGFEGEFNKQAYHTYFVYSIADFMARNNFGPEQTLNAFQRMGYDGVLGEMYEERYSDFFKGLFGLDDKKTHSVKDNIKTAFANITTELTLDQLIAEAVGFSFPAVVRAGTLNVQRVLAGDSNIDRANLAGRNYRDAALGMTVVQDTYGTFDKVMTERRSQLEKNVADAQAELDSQRDMLTKQGITDATIVGQQTSDLKAKVDEAKTMLDSHDRYVADTLKTNGIKIDETGKAVSADETVEGAAEDIAGKLMRFAIGPSLYRSGTFAEKIAAKYTSEQLADAQAAQDALLKDAPFLGRSYDLARQYDTGEDNISLWRKISSKTIGIASALICGEPALAQSNSIRWAAIDSGLDPMIAQDLGELHRSMSAKVLSDMRLSEGAMKNLIPDREEIEKRINADGYEEKAKELVRKHLLFRGIRMFAHSEMLDRAIISTAESSGYWYDPRKKVLSRKDGSTTQSVTLEQFHKDHREEVEGLRDRIGTELFRMLVDPDTVLGADQNLSTFMAYIRMKPGDMSEDQTARALAAEMSGLGNLITQRELAPGVKVEDQLAADSMSIPETLIKNINGYLGRKEEVPDELAERLASSLKMPLGDMSDGTLAERRSKAIQIARIAGGILTGDVRVFVKHLDIGESRLVDDPVRMVYFTRNPQTGLWTTTDRIRDEEAKVPGTETAIKDKVATFSGNDEQTAAAVKEAGLEEIEGRRIVLTPARSLVTTDPILMLQKLDLAEPLMKAGRVQNGDGSVSYARVHPALRIDETTKAPLLADARAKVTGAVSSRTWQDVLREEVFKADYYATHKNIADYNFTGEKASEDAEKRWEALRHEYAEMYENVYGDKGYLTAMHQVLTSAGVSCPTTNDMVHQALGRKMAGTYSIGLPQYASRRGKSAAFYVSVDYAAGVDPVSSMVSAAVMDGLRKYGPRLFNGPESVAKTDVQTFFHDVDAIIQEKLRSPEFDDTQRNALSRLHKEITQATKSPSPRAIALMATAFSCGQLSRATAEDLRATAHDQALSIISSDVRNLTSYAPFSAFVDVILGGSGFSQLRAMREAGATNKDGSASTASENGIFRILGITGANNDTNKKTVDMIKPGGMTWTDFEKAVNDYAASHFRDRIEKTGKLTFTPTRPASAFGRIQTLFAKAGFNDENDVFNFLKEVMKLEPFSNNSSKVSELANLITTLRSEHDELVSELNSLKAENEALKSGTATPETAARINEVRTRIVSIQRADMEVCKQLSDAKVESQTLANGGVSDIGTVASTSTDRKPAVNDEEDVGDNLAESVDVTGVDDGQNARVEYEVQDNMDGTYSVVVHSVGSASDAFTADSMESTDTAIIQYIRANTGDSGAAVTEEFRNAVFEFTGGSMPEDTVSRLWNYYSIRGDFINASVGRIREDDPLSAQDVPEDENDASTSHNFGEKYLAAFSNKVLDQYLTVYRYVAPQNGRSFLAGINGIRDGIVALRERMEIGGTTDVKLDATLRALDALFNSETVTDKGIENHADREALFTSRVKSLEDGSFGVTFDEMIQKLMEHDETGMPRFRQAGFFLSFVRSMSPESRRRFMTLACSSVQTSQVGIRNTGSELQLEAYGNHYGAVSSFAATGSFSRFSRIADAAEVKGIADRLVASCFEKNSDGSMKHNFSAEGRKTLQSLVAEVANVLAPVIGHESPILQALTSPRLFDSIRSGQATSLGRTVDRQIKQLISACSAIERTGISDEEKVPPLVQSVVRVLREYASYLKSDRYSHSAFERRSTLDRLVITEFSVGLDLGSTDSPSKDASASTIWSRVLSAYSTGLPETIVSARTIPERNSKIGSKIVAALQDAPPVIRQFVDKDISDETGFAYHAYQVWAKTQAAKDLRIDVRDERTGAITGSREHTAEEHRQYFIDKVLPMCRQRLVWPDSTHTPILAKTVDRDYTRRELYEACSSSFVNTWYAKNDPGYKGKDKGDQSKSWYVPVYNGDHSAGVMIRIPTSVVLDTIVENFGQLSKFGKNGAEVYHNLANLVCTWLGMDAFGTDTKRSSLACSEFPGRSMRGVRYVNGELQKGECRIHIVHNYGMEGHNDAFLGTTLATGYGLRAQQDTAKDINTETHKLHVMSAAGTDLTMIKSLITSMWKYSGKQMPGMPVARGAFLDGMATRTLMDYIIKFREDMKDSDISTSFLVDEDSMKVGVLNSKAMGHYTGGDKKFEPLMKYIFKALAASGHTDGSLKGEALDKALCDNLVNGSPVADPDGKFRFNWYGSDGKIVRRTIGELLHAVDGNSVQVNVVDDGTKLSGKTLDFSYADNSLMSYAVANVSHRDEPGMEHMPRNNAIDGLVMGQGLIRDGLVSNDGVESINEGLRSLAYWGLLNSVVGTSPLNFDAAKEPGTTAYDEMIHNGADPNCAEVNEQATRDVYSRLTKVIKPPLKGLACPLVSTGAVYHEFTKEERAERKRQGLPDIIGEVRDHNPKGSFMNRLHQGSRVLSRQDARLYKVSRTLGYAHINMALTSVNSSGKSTSHGFRYGWFLNLDQIDKVYTEVFGVDSMSVDERGNLEYVNRLGGDTNDSAYAMSHMAAAKLEVIMNHLYRVSRNVADMEYRMSRISPDSTDERAAAQAEFKDSRKKLWDLRDTILQLFRDHHGVQLSTYDRVYRHAVSFDDLQVLRTDGTHGFDRAAVEEDMPDPDSLTGTGKGMWLAGTTIGLPRTPSYNGSMWCQTVRASTPCTEVGEQMADGTVLYRPGDDAMVMPDPQTLKILGCDHDGDKTMCYMFHTSASLGTMQSFGGGSLSQLLAPGAFNVSDNDLLDSVKQFIRTPGSRELYIEQMKQNRWVIEGDKVFNERAGRMVQRPYRVSNILASMISNQIVRSFFDMSRSLRVDNGEEAKDFYGTPMARATRAQPLDASEEKGKWKQLKDKTLSVFNYLKDSVIADAKTGAQVSTSAGIADRARGSIVSWASILHLAQYSGLYNDTLFRFRDDGAKSRFMKWVDFIYGIDGVSNATFDDIKEQICLRVGWTPGMVDTFIADMLFSDTEPPTTSDGFFKLIDDYITNIAQHKSRFWMMVMSEPSDSDDPLYTTSTGHVWSSRSMHQAVWDIFRRQAGKESNGDEAIGAPATQGEFTASVRAALGIAEDTRGKYRQDTSARVVTPGLHEFVTEYLRQIGSIEGLEAPEGKTYGELERDDQVDLALRALVSDISRRKGVNAASGYMYWIVATMAGNTVNVSDLVKDYIRWSNGTRHLNDAREFVRSFNFLKADPGSGAMMGRVERMSDKFTRMISRAEFNGAESAVLRNLVTMFTANMCAYSATSAMTMQGSGVVSSNARAQAVGRWASSAINSHSPQLRHVVECMLAEPGLNPNMLMQLEGQQTTVPFFLASLVGMDSGLTNGAQWAKGTEGLLTSSRIWDVMETMADAVIPGAAEAGAADQNSLWARTAGFDQAFVALYGALYGLASSSNLARRFSGLYYLRCGKPDAEDMADFNYAPIWSGTEQLVPVFRDTDEDSQRLMWDSTDLLVNGSLDTARRSTAGSAKATEYVLSTDNLVKFLEEINGTYADAVSRAEKYGTKEEADSLRKNPPVLIGRVERAITVLRALDKMNGSPVRITPSMLLGKLLPVYATSVARSMAPNPKSRSVLNFVRGKYAELSRTVARFDSGVLDTLVGETQPGYRFMDILRATDLAIPLYEINGKGTVPPTLANLSVTDLSQMLDVVAGSENDHGLYTYEDSDTYNALLGKIRGTRDSARGKIPNGSIRRNPRNRHYLGFLEGTQILKAAHEYISSVMNGELEPPKPPEKEVKDVSRDNVEVTTSDEVIEDVKRLADLARSSLPNWADVEYTGGNTFTIRSRGGLTGAAATLFAGAMSGVTTGARTEAVIQVHVGGKDATRKVDINSPAFAASFCNAAFKLGITAEQFMSLTRDEREALVNAYTGASVKNGIANFALSTPSWSIDGKGIATLCGEIQLAKGASGKKLFHEYFHSMIGMFRTMGVFSAEDVKYFRARFGNAVKGTGTLFNEEKAADQFADYVDSMTHGAVPVNENIDGKTRSIFRRIFDALKKLFSAITFKYGFRYDNSKMDSDTTLFDVVLNGYTGLSNSRRDELINEGKLNLKAGSAVSVDQQAQQLKVVGKLMRSVDNQSMFDRNRKDTAEAAKESAAKRMAQDRTSSEFTPTYRQMTEHERKVADAFHRRLIEELGSGKPNRFLVSNFVDELCRLRLDNPQAVLDDLNRTMPVSVGFSVDVDRDRIMNDQKAALAAKRATMRQQNAATAAATDEEAYGRLEEIAKTRMAEEAAAKAGAPLVEPAPTSLDVETKADENAVINDNPDIDPVIAGPVSKLRTAAQIAASFDPVDHGGKAAILAGPQRIVQVAAELARAGYNNLSADDRAIIDGSHLVDNTYDRLHSLINARQEVNKAALRKAEIAHGVALAAGKKLAELTGNQGYTDGRITRALMYLYSERSRMLNDAAIRTNRQRARTIFGASPVAHSIRYASSASMAGAVMAASGRKFGSLIAGAMKQLEDIRRIAGTGNCNEKALNYIESQLIQLDGMLDLSAILENRRQWDFALDTVLGNLFSGIRRGALDASTGEYGDYVPVDAPNERGKANQEIYQFSENSKDIDGASLRQRMLKIAADAIFITAAQVKFAREFGFQPGNFHHDAWTGYTTQQPMEFMALTRNFGVGDSTLASGSPIIAEWNQPEFIAANLDDWYAGTIRETFGSLPVREMMMKETAKVRGHLATLTRKINLLSMYWGLNRAENRRLLKLKQFKASHEMTGDFIQSLDGEKYYEGFSNESGTQGEVTDAALTRDEYRDVQLMHQLARAYMNGDDRIITGIDRIRFDPRDLHQDSDDVLGNTHRGGSRNLVTRSQLSIDTILQRMKDLTTMPEGSDLEKLNAVRGKKYREMSPIEITLYNLSMQWQSSVTGLQSDQTNQVARSTIGLYNRLVDGVLAAAKAADDEFGDTSKLAPGQYNDFMLRYLEARGLVVATAGDETLKDPQTGREYLTEATLCINAADINRMWEKSDALNKLAEVRVLDKLTGSAREKAIEDVKRNRLTAKAIADELGEAVKQLKRDLKDTPWLTQGEAKYLHRLDSMIETVEGAGSFMYHALRAERNLPRETAVRLSRHELTWQNMIADLQLSGKGFKDLTAPQLNMIADYFNTEERGDALRNALADGKYAAGTAASTRTGLVINPPNETCILGTMMHDVATQIYRRQLERRMMVLEGRDIPNPESEDALARMIHQYEEVSQSTEAPVKPAYGLTGTQLYRMHGTLPANFTAGHAVMTMMRGLQNALQWRSALANMMLTPDIDGDPLYLMSPDEFHGDEAGLSDGFWETAARWWASRLHVEYNAKLSGKQNAKRIFETVQSGGKRDGGTYAKFTKGEKRYASLGQDEIDGSAIAGVMAMVEPDDGGMINRWGSSRGMFSLDGSEALGYARQLFQTSRLMGDNGKAQWLSHILAWSKTMSVAYSFFFPLATRWESPTAAVGGLATLGSNLDPEFLRRHGATMSAIQKFFTLGQKEGWIDKNFIGFKDVIRMMDTNDPFLNDLVMWAESIGVTMSDTVMNPLENQTTTIRDVDALKDVIARNFGDNAAANFSMLADALLFRQSEKAFTYALNATKLAVAAQVALKMKAEAIRQNKAFDPIRDMTGYAEYVDSEVGGVNPMRYAWAHPEMRRTLGKLMFSWQWTRTAWEAGGGSIIEEVLFGGHAASKQQRSITFARWLRMYCEVLIGVPFILQIVTKFLATAFAAACGLPPDPDDDRDKWFTWENEKNLGMYKANMDPFLKLIQKLDNTYFDGAVERFKKGDHQMARMVLGTGAAMAFGAKRGLSGSLLAAVPGAIGSSVLPSLIPEYTGNDPFNLSHRRQIGIGIGKQGLEVMRYADKPVDQLFSKLNPGIQAVVGLVLGYNPVNPDVTKMTPSQRIGNLLTVFRPFSMSGVAQFGDAGVLGMYANATMSSSNAKLVDETVDILNKWVDNDARGYSAGGRQTYANATSMKKGRVVTLAPMLADVRKNAKMTGVLDFDKEIMMPALQKVIPRLNRELIQALPDRVDDPFNSDKVRAAVRKLHRIGRSLKYIEDGVVTDYERALGGKKLPGAFRRRIHNILSDADRDPFSDGVLGSENRRNMDY